MSIATEELLNEEAGATPVVDDDASTRAPRLFSAAFLSVFDQGVVSATNFATTVVIGRLCSKDELGIYSLAFTVLLLMRGIQYQLVIAPYMIYWSRREAGTQPAYLGSSFFHQTAYTVIVAAAILLHVGIVTAYSGSSANLPIELALLAALPFLLMREFIRHLALSHLKITLALTIDTVVAVVQIGGLLALAAFGLLTIPTVYLVMGLACVVACAAWPFTAKLPVRVETSRILSDWRDNWSFGKWALGGHLVGSSTPYIMPWIVVLARDPAATGALAAASSLIGPTNVFVTGLGNLLGPKAAVTYSTDGVQALKRLLWHCALLFVAALGVLCAGLYAFGGTIAELLYGDQYADLGTVITLLAFGVLANSLRMTAGTGLWAIERPGANFFADLTTMGLTLGAAAALVPPLGVTGAACSVLIGTSGGMLVSIMTLKALLNTESQPSEVAAVVPE